MSQYTAKHFIKFFSAIPDEKWKVGASTRDEKTGCAIHHAFKASSECGHALTNLFARANLLVSEVNDTGYGPLNFPEATPKARILAALEYLEILDNPKK